MGQEKESGQQLIRDFKDWLEQSLWQNPMGFRGGGLKENEVHINLNSMDNEMHNHILLINPCQRWTHNFFSSFSKAKQGDSLSS